MKIVYKLFKPELIQEGDTFWTSVGGFSVQPFKIEEVNSHYFRYRNDRFAMKFDFGENVFPSGFVERKTSEGFERYVSPEVLGIEKLLRGNDQDILVDE